MDDVEMQVELRFAVADDVAHKYASEVECFISQCSDAPGFQNCWKWIGKYGAKVFVYGLSLHTTGIVDIK